MKEMIHHWKSFASQKFNSSNKFSQAEIGALGMTFYKGAPERLLRTAEQASATLMEKKLNPLDLYTVSTGRSTKQAGRAMRILAFRIFQAEDVREDLYLMEDLVTHRIWPLSGTM